MLTVGATFGFATTLIAIGGRNSSAVPLSSVLPWQSRGGASKRSGLSSRQKAVKGSPKCLFQQGVFR